MQIFSGTANLHKSPRFSKLPSKELCKFAMPLQICIISSIDLIFRAVGAVLLAALSLHEHFARGVAVNLNVDAGGEYIRRLADAYASKGVDIALRRGSRFCNRIFGRESLTLFLSDGISPPSDAAKLIKILD